MHVFLLPCEITVLSETPCEVIRAPPTGNHFGLSLSTDIYDVKEFKPSYKFTVFWTASREKQ